MVLMAVLIHFENVRTIYENIEVNTPVVVLILCIILCIKTERGRPAADMYIFDIYRLENAQRFCIFFCLQRERKLI